MHTLYRIYTLLQIAEPERLHVSCESRRFSEHGGVVLPLTTPQTMEEKLGHRRTDTTHGPTYSMAKVIGATAWQKGFIC